MRFIITTEKFKKQNNTNIPPDLFARNAAVFCWDLTNADLANAKQVMKVGLKNSSILM
jgi:hypothetical protein